MNDPRTLYVHTTPTHGLWTSPLHITRAQRACVHCARGVYVVTWYVACTSIHVYVACVYAVVCTWCVRCITCAQRTVCVGCVRIATSTHWRIFSEHTTDTSCTSMTSLNNCHATWQWMHLINSDVKGLNQSWQWLKKSHSPVNIYPLMRWTMLGTFQELFCWETMVRFGCRFEDLCRCHHGLTTLWLRAAAPLKIRKHKIAGVSKKAMPCIYKHISICSYWLQYSPHLQICFYAYQCLLSGYLVGLILVACGTVQA